jgi:hypothetical protein
MPTADRPWFVTLALELFRAQDHRGAELIVVDGGRDSVEDLCRGVQSLRYVRTLPGTSIGAMRNLACAIAKGAFIVHWDDDDWYGPDRLRQQIEPIASGRADVTGFYNRYTFDLRDGTMWTISEELHRRMFVGDVHGGTLAYRRSLLEEGLAYDDVSLGEDAALLKRLIGAGARVEQLPNEGQFVYVRHGHNAWRFVPGRFLDAQGWSKIPPPLALSAATIEHYRSAHRSRQERAVAPRARVAREMRVDCLGNTEIIAPKTRLAFDRCVAVAATESYAGLLEGALASLARFGGLQRVPIVVLLEETAETSEAVAMRYGAHLVKFRRLRGPAPSIKGVLYSMSHVVKANQYLCLDADLLVLDTLLPLFERHAALPKGMVLIGREAAAGAGAPLARALRSVYGATHQEVEALLGSDPRLFGERSVVNDGVFVAHHQALVAIDGFLQRSRIIREWVGAKVDVWWRQKAALNIALAHLGAIAPMDDSYNAQLHVERPEPPLDGGRRITCWRGRPARVLHFNGAGRSAFDAWKAHVLGGLG